MSKTKAEIMKELKGGLSCTQLSTAECNIVNNREFVDKNSVKRACAIESVPFSTKQWCRDRIIF